VRVPHKTLRPGDLYPLLFSEDTVKLTDFGISTFRGSVTLTLTGLIIGTPEYISPEQAEGSRELTPASDI
jgi:serine/threonine-protein kinase